MNKPEPIVIHYGMIINWRKMKKRKVIYLSVLVWINVLLSVSQYVQAQQIGRWEKLGERIVNLTVDKDVIRCGHKGTFTTIRFHVDRAPVTFLRVIVRYANGSVDHLKLNQTVRQGGNSRYLDLRGGKRIIRDITVYYKSESKRPKHHYHPRKALVQVWGRH